MSLHADMEALLTEKVARLAQLEIRQSQLEVQRLRDTSRINELEQELNSLKADKQPSTERLDGQVGVSTSSSEPILRAEIVQLQNQIAAKDATIEERGKENTALLATVRRYREAFGREFAAGLLELGTCMQSKLDDGDEEPPEALTAAIEHMKLKLTAEAATKQRKLPKGQTPEEVSVNENDDSAEHQPQKQQTTGVSVTAGEKSAEPIQTSPPKGFQGNLRTRPHAPSPILTPFTHAESSAKRKAGHESPFEPEKRPRFICGALSTLWPHSINSSNSNAGARNTFGSLDEGREKPRVFGELRGRGNLRGFGNLRSNQGPTARSRIEDANSTESSTKAPESSKAVVPAKHGERAELGVTTPEGMDQPSRKSNVDVPVATTKDHNGQDIPDKLDLDDLEALRQIVVRPGWTAFSVRSYREFGYPLPWEEDEKNADTKTVAPSVPTTLQSTSNNRRP